MVTTCLSSERFLINLNSVSSYIMDIGKLVVEARRGDQQAYETLVNHFIKLVQFTAYSIINDGALAEDITQDTFIKAWQNLDNLKEPAKFPAWLLTICRNTARDYKKGQPQTVRLEEVAEPVSISQTVEPKLSERQERLLETIRQLPEDYQNILMLRYFDDCSYKEIAQRLSMNVSAVGEKLCRIRQMLRGIERRAKSVEKQDTLCSTPYAIKQGGNYEMR